MCVHCLLLQPRSTGTLSPQDTSQSSASNGSEKGLSEEGTEAFQSKIRENIRKRLSDDGYYSYVLLGEAYIHEMTDGEAMASQNKKEIRSTVFEIR